MHREQLGARAVVGWGWGCSAARGREAGRQGGCIAAGLCKPGCGVLAVSGEASGLKQGCCTVQLRFLKDHFSGHVAKRSEQIGWGQGESRGQSPTLEGVTLCRKGHMLANPATLPSCKLLSSPIPIFCGSDF